MLSKEHRVKMCPVRSTANKTIGDCPLFGTDIRMVPWISKPMNTWFVANLPLGNSCWDFAGKTNRDFARNAGQDLSSKSSTADADVNNVATFSMIFQSAGSTSAG